MRRSALLAAGAALLLYAALPVLLFGTEWGFVNYDDPFVTGPDNPVVRDGWSGLLTVLTEPFMNAWLPLYYGSLGLDHALFGDWTLGWHLHSAALHALGAALVVLIAGRMGLRPLAALGAGLVFALHPVASENVAWVAGRKDVLSFAWMAGAALCYLRAEDGRRGWHLAGAACLFVSMTAKASTVVLPLLLAIHALLLGRRRERGLRALAPVVPYAVVAGLMTLLHLWIARSQGTIGQGTGAGFGSLLLANLAVVWNYVRSLLLPVPAWMSVEHGLRPFDVAPVAVVLGAAVLIAWGGALAAAWRRRPAFAAVLLAVPVALLPFNNLFPRTSVLFAERYAYVALLPLALGAGALLAARFGRLGVGLAAAALGVCAGLRLPVWRDSVALWEDAAEKAPHSVLVRMQLAEAYDGRARSAAGTSTWLQRAGAAWRSARTGALADLRAGPRAGDAPFLARLRHVQACTGLGTHLFINAASATDARIQLREAVELFDEAELELEPLDAPGRAKELYLIRSNRATIRQLLGEREAALQDWRGAALVDPTAPQALNRIAQLCAELGRAEDALAALERSAEVAPHDPVAAVDRANVRLALGDAGGAKQDLARSLEKHPDDVPLLVASGRLDAFLMRPLDAEQHFRRAAELRPDDEAIQQGLAAALLQQAQAFAARDDADAARAAAAKAAAAAPGSSAPEQILGIVARRLGDLDQAADHFRRAHELHPEGERIRSALASVLVERAAGFLREDREGLAFHWVEEATTLEADAIATPRGRVEKGIRGWPPLERDIDDRTLVARQSAQRGLVFLADGRPLEAVVELEVAAAGASEPGLRHVVLQLLTRARFLVGRIDPALEAAVQASQVARRVPGVAAHRALEDLAAAWTEAGIARRGRGESESAELAFGRAREVLDEAVEAGLPEAVRAQRLGEILFAEEDFIGATIEFDRSVELDPERPDPFLDRAAVWRSHYLMEEDKSFLDAAEDDLERALRAAPSDPRAMAALGEVLLMNGRTSEAFPWLQRAVLADPSQHGARAMLASLIVRAGRSHLEKHGEWRFEEATRPKAEKELEEAQSAARRALDLDPPGPEALLFRADVQRAGGDWQGALGSLLVARERFPSDQGARDALAGYYVDLGYASLLKRSEAEAVEALREALAVEGAEVDREEIDVRLRGVAYNAFKRGAEAQMAGRVREAEDEFRLSVRADPTPEGFFQLGMALAAQDDLAKRREATGWLAQVLKERPDHLEARYHRGRLLLRVGRLDDAEKDLREWLARAPDDDARRDAVLRELALLDGLRENAGGD